MSESVTIHLLPAYPVEDIIGVTRTIQAARQDYLVALDLPDAHTSADLIAKEVREAESANAPVHVLTIDRAEIESDDSPALGVVETLSGAGQVIFDWDGEPLASSADLEAEHSVEQFQTAMVLMRACSGNPVSALGLAQNLGNVSTDPDFYIHVMSVLIETFPAAFIPDVDAE